MTTLALSDMQRDIAVEIARRAPVTPLDILDIARLHHENPALAEAIAGQSAKQFRNNPYRKDSRHGSQDYALV